MYIDYVYVRVCVCVWVHRFEPRPPKRRKTVVCLSFKATNKCTFENTTHSLSRQKVRQDGPAQNEHEPQPFALNVRTL